MEDVREKPHQAPTLGSRGITITKWPLQYDDPKELLEKVHKALQTVSKSSLTHLSHSLGKAAGFFPFVLIPKSTDWFSSLNQFSVAHSNVPVTTGPEYFQGIEIMELTTANSNIMGGGVLVSLGGVNNQQRASFSVNSNKFASKEIAQSFGTYFAEEIQALANFATV
ncbi:unnamed protein product [Allacma fusca]|uniref:O-acyltransferase WSD1 C-terminal domain-containing protein n=1 Tax=Allacma fusca TaxID=39272 RepID=A0A8J2PEV5_9HEXA|nr:unnamed protein product [Allacma fusca]